MKKKTVITTEKREVWIIRQQPEPNEDHDESTGAGSTPRSLSSLLDQSLDAEVSFGDQDEKQQ